MCGETRQEKIVRLERELAEAKGETFLEIGQRVTMSGVIQGIDEDDSIYTYKVALDGAQPGEAFWFPKSALKLEASTPADQSGLLKVGTRVKVGYNSRTEVGVIVNVDMEDDIVPYRIQFDGDNYPMWVSSSRIIEVIE